MALIQNAIGEWWISPIATTLEEQDRTVFGAIADDGSILACQIDHSSGATLRVPVAVAPVDDHNVPSLWAAPGRRMVIMWTHHSQERFIHCKVSDRSGDITSLAAAEDQATPDQASTTSYTQIYHLPHASTPEVDSFIVFSRIAARSWSVIPFTVDQDTGTVTWGETVQFMISTGQCYLATAPDYDPDTGRLVIRVAWGYNPAQPTHSVRYVEVDAISGEVSSPVDSSVSGNIYSGAGLPLVDEDIAPLIGESDEGWRRRLFYVRPGPMSRAIAYADWPISDPDRAIYRLMAQDETTGAWSVRDYGIAGPRVGFTAAANYIPGMAFPTPCTSDVVYVARQAGETATVERIEFARGARSTTTLVSDDEYRWIRPTPPVDGGDAVIAYRVHRYAEDSFRDYLADAHYLIEQADPGPITTVDRRIRILAGELRTGRIVAELPVSDASRWAMAHREAGDINASIPLTATDLDPAQIGGIIAATEGARCYLAAVIGNTALEAGPIWTHEYQPATGTLQVVAKGLWSLFDHRYVMAALTATPSAPNPWRDWEVTYQGLSLGTIAKRLVELSMSHTGGQLPVRLPGDQPGDHERTYYGFELATVAERISQLMEVIGGPDIAFRPRLTQGGLAIEWDMIIGDPILSQAGEDHLWDAGSARSSIQGLGVKRDWTELASAAWATGGGQDKALLMRRVENRDLIEAGFPLVETKTSHTTVRRGTTLDGHAESNAAYGRRPWMTLDLEVRTEEQPLLGSYWPGDYARVRPPANHPYLQAVIPDGEYRTRIMRITGGMSDHVSLTLAPTQEDR